MLVNHSQLSPRRLERPIRDNGYSMSPLSGLVDRVTREVVIPGFQLREEALTDLDHDFASDPRELPMVGVGRYPLLGWTLLATGESGAGTAPPGATMFSALAQGLGRWLAFRHRVDLLGVLSHTAPGVVLAPEPTRAVEQVLQMLGDGVPA